jgi:hypothetical protein
LFLERIFSTFWQIPFSSSTTKIFAVCSISHSFAYMFDGVRTIVFGGIYSSLYAKTRSIFK